MGTVSVEESSAQDLQRQDDGAAVSTAYSSYGGGEGYVGAGQNAYKERSRENDGRNHYKSDSEGDDQHRSDDEECHFEPDGYQVQFAEEQRPPQYKQ